MSAIIYDHEITYFIQGEITARIKIGKTSTSVHERLRILQTGSPDVLKCIGICFGPMRTEECLHQKFSKYRLHGEWFSPHSEIFSFITDNCIFDELAFYHVYKQIADGKLTFDEALKIGTNRLLELAEQHSVCVLSKIYTGSDGINILTGEKCLTSASK